MKRTFLLVPLALLATLWAVNWKLNHPPQTDNDRNFARLIKGADTLDVTPCLGRRHVLLKGEKMRSLVESVHLSSGFVMPLSSCDARYTLTFKRQGRDLATFDLDFDGRGLEQKAPYNGVWAPALEPRTGRQLERAITDLMRTVPSDS